MKIIGAGCISIPIKVKLKVDKFEVLDRLTPWSRFPLALAVGGDFVMLRHQGYCMLASNQSFTNR
jgi:hypothetical protein